MLESKEKGKLNQKRPLIVTFIGDVSVLCASLSVLAVLLAALFPEFLKQIGISVIWTSSFSKGFMRLLLSIFFLTASFGFLRLKKWGYWLLISCNIFFLVEGIVCVLQNKQAPNIIITFILLLFIIPTKGYFDQKCSVAVK
jgi:hypothetical protein